MSVLVEGMEMPKSCFNCRCPRACQAINRRIDEMDRTEWFPQDHRHSDCPLIEVHEPHGDLIDREELQHIIGQFNLNWEYGQGVSDCWDALLNAPTIIPASEEGET